jgi:hypothetical protein
MAIFPGSAIPSDAAAYTIDNSLRFDDDADPVLSRTPTSAGNRKTYTVSAWVKRGNLTLTYPGIFSGGTGSDVDLMRFNSDDTFGYRASASYEVASTAVYRDPSAWYHLVMAVNTTESVSTNRVKLYVNGDQITDFSLTDYPAEDFEGSINNTVIHYIGTGDPDNPDTRNWDGYLAEFYFIDGSAELPSSFGELDSTTNQWKPIDASGLTFGTNGFYQKYGGTIETTDSFTSTGSATWTCPSGITGIKLLVVAGGGGAGRSTWAPGGGGAGGLAYISNYTVTEGTTYNLSVGAGGAGSTTGDGTGDLGTDSVFDSSDSEETITAKGGGGGGTYVNPPTSGGSGGGGGANSSGDNGGASSNQAADFGSYTSVGFGNSGGNGSTESLGGGGQGGGAGGTPAGKDYSSVFGTGYGESGWFSGGGGGGSMSESGGSGPSSGGQGGGGDGTTGTGGNATVNTGGGGGGGKENAGGGSGGSGVILIKYGVTFGEDSSGEGNDFAVTNLVATDQMIDTPTNNFCTFNPLSFVTPGWQPQTISEGNLYARMSSDYDARGSMAMESGKWYWEVLVGEAGTNYMMNGIGDPTSTASMYATSTDGIAYYGNNGNIYKQAPAASYGAPYTAGDIIGVAFNMDDREITFYKNDASQGVVTGVPSTPSVYVAAISSASWSAGWINFGQDSSFAGEVTAQGNQDSNDVGDFYYEPPTDFLALCTNNLPDPEIALPGGHFNTVLYTGDGNTGRSVTGTGFAPGFLWIKNRDATDKHINVDSVRGPTIYWSSNTGGTFTTDSNVVTSLDSDGFTVGDNVAVNTNTEDFVSWNWKVGGTPTATNVATSGVMTSGSVFQDGVSNTSFTPGSTIYPKKISANTTAGISVVKYVGPGGSTDTFAHGLSLAPSLVIIKADAGDAAVVGSDHMASWTGGIGLSTTNAVSDSDTLWRDLAPTASLVRIGTAGDVNDGGGATSYSAYCFHSVEGYSKVGSYAGNSNADGPFVYTGFKPAYILQKCSNNTSAWQIWDVKRDTYNVAEKRLLADQNSAELDGHPDVDILSNGFKFRRSAGDFNTTGDDNIYIAFAESPFKYSNAR